MRAMVHLDMNRLAAWLLIALALPSGLHGGEVTLDEVIARHCRARESMAALKAQFTQKKVFTLFDETETSKGAVYFAQPDRIRWQYSEPDQSSTVINGTYGWSVFPHLKQVQKFTLEGSKTNKVLSIVGFGSCGGPLQESFEIVLAGSGKNAYVLQMTPTDEDVSPFFSRVDLTLDRKDYLPRKIELYEKSGDILIFEFSNLDRKVGLEAALFEYVVPEGYEVVDYR